MPTAQCRPRPALRGPRRPVADVCPTRQAWSLSSTVSVRRPVAGAHRLARRVNLGIMPALGPKSPTRDMRVSKLRVDVT